MAETEERISSIKIAKDFRLCQDRWCCWIEQEVEYKDRKTGETKKTWRRVAGYSPTYESLFNDFFQQKCFREIEGSTAGNAVKKMSQIAAETKEMIHTLLGEVKR